MKNLKLATDLQNLCNNIYDRLSLKNDEYVTFRKPYIRWEKGADHPQIICEVVFNYSEAVFDYRELEGFKEKMRRKANKILDEYKQFYNYIFLE